MKIFKKLFKKKRKADEKNELFGQMPLERFESLLLTYYKQECALEDGNSYFEPQDTLAGEMFDNAIRIKFLKAENPQHEGQYDEEEIKTRAKAFYEKDKANLRLETGENENDTQWHEVLMNVPP